MHAYFQPLRRKIGVATLAMACVFAAAWVRSHFVIDQLRYGAPNKTAFLLVQNGLPGRFHLDCCNMQSNSKNFKFKWKTNPTPEPGESEPTDVLGCFFYRWVDLPEEISSDGYQEYSRFGFSLYHRTVVIPLTLLSASLLLRKSRVAKPTAISEK